ncbi:hypothetical protein QOT17_002993 [Balamuthia mandrillaris]
MLSQSRSSWKQFVMPGKETQGNIELAAIDLNALLHPGDAFNSATEAPSPVVTPEAIYVEGLDIDHDDDIEVNCGDKVEPPITAPILLNATGPPPVLLTMWHTSALTVAPVSYIKASMRFCLKETLCNALVLVFLAFLCVTLPSDTAQKITEGIHNVLQCNQQVPHGPSSSLLEGVIYFKHW